MRKWPKRVGVFLVLGLVPAVLFILPLFSPSKVTRENFNRLREGMTEEEVGAILGPPGEYYGPDHPARSAPSSTAAGRWGGDGVEIVVIFREGDPGHPRRLEFASFHPLPRESYVDRWLRRLGL